MNNIKFITIDDAKDIYNGLIQKYGGTYGIRDEGLLDSAINTPSATFSSQYLHSDIYEMASAYAYHIIKNHPFVDGNKRAGIAIAIIFLAINDIEIEMTNEELYELTIKIATSEISKQEIANTFRKKTSKN
ncbi:MAG: Death-on-curing family protein [candidate division TM6 bacterium GW2011_GWF2_30_66]|jgi:death-on-curing protein|nr:MAG: Death-on-curing family protein [candidate division TM6 bacterium GW2011_GWF2_30_66]